VTLPQNDCEVYGEGQAPLVPLVFVTSSTVLAGPLPGTSSLAMVRLVWLSGDRPGPSGLSGVTRETVMVPSLGLTRMVN